MGASSNSASANSTMMATSAGVGGFANLASAYAESQAAGAQGEFQRQQYELNAAASEAQAKDAIRRGEISADQVRKEGEKAKGAQRAALAAQGIDVNSGSAGEVQLDTERLIAQDVATVRNNAFREAMGYKTKAIGERTSGTFASQSARNRSASTLLTGGMNAVSSGLKAYRDTQK